MFCSLFSTSLAKFIADQDTCFVAKELPCDTYINYLYHFILFDIGIPSKISTRPLG